MKHDVFISHAATDKVIADEITNHLESGGVKCWVAPRDIRPGDTWGGSIVKAIEHCSIMVVLFSADSNKSQQVLREVERAVQKNVVVLPFRIDEIEPTGDMEYFLSATHWLDALTGDLNPHYELLLVTTLSILNREKVVLEDVTEEIGDTKLASNKSTHPSKNEPKIEILEPVSELETMSQMELASELDKEKKKSEHSLEAIENPSLSSEPSNTPFESPDLTLERSSRHRSEKIDPDSSNTKWLIGAAIVATFIGMTLTWFAIDSEPATRPSADIDNSISQEDTNKSLGSSTQLVSKAETSKPSTETLKSNIVESKKPENDVEQITSVYTDNESISDQQLEPQLDSDNNGEVDLHDQPTPEEIARAEQEKRAQEEADRLKKLKAEKIAKRRALIAKAESGDLESQQTLAEMYLAGKGVAKDKSKAVNWYRTAAAQGDSEAQFQLSQLINQNPELALEGETHLALLSASAEANNVSAQKRLAEMYTNGSGVEQSDQFAFQWTLKAAESGDLNSQKNLATLYEFCIGTDKDLTSAIKWYKTAGDRGDMSSQLYLEK